jgi:hypothetical protein
MLTWEEDVEAAALRAQGWSIAAIARHLDRDPKTIRAHLAGERVPGQRRSSAPDGFAPFADYVAARLTEDRHVWATALYDEVVALGFRGSYPSFTRPLRTRGLRPRCEACASVKGRETVDIAPSAGGGDPVGLGGAAGCAVGWHRLCAGRGAVVLQPGPRGLERGHRSAASGRGAGRGGAPLGWADPSLAG